MTGAASVATPTIDALLAASGLPRAEALMLLSHVAGRRRESLIADGRDALPPAIAEAFDAVARRRRGGEPVAYLVGRRAFYGRAFAVDPRVLIPRPETESLVDEALRAIDRRDGGRQARVLDLGTGSGAIAITLVLERPAIEVVATDASAAALEVAVANATRLGAGVAFVAGDWYDALGDAAPFDVVVSNPPYVAAGDPHLAIGDLRFEPAIALTDARDGLAHLRTIVAGAPTRLVAGGALIVEHGHDQGTAVRALFDAHGFASVTTERDLAGLERITAGLVR